MNLIEQISTVRQYMPDFLQYVRDLLDYEHQAGAEEAAGLWLPVYDDDDEIVGIERIREVDESISESGT